MRRVVSAERDDWQARVESVGLVYHTPDGRRYWDESAHYEFSLSEIEMLERAAAEVQRLCAEAAQRVIDEERFGEFAIHPRVAAAIAAAWNAGPPSIYGRFDFAYDGSGPPKLLEYNADTPTSLLEAAVVQWHWLQDVAPANDQWNSIHERLVAKWRELAPVLAPVVHFAHVAEATGEDLMTVTYLRDTASEAGIGTVGVAMADIGADESTREFVDLAGVPMRSVFKLYPWEWLMNEEFRGRLLESLESGSAQWIEPIWKMLWSNKAILPVLWEQFPDHPNLLPAYRKDPHGLTSYVKKPKLSREGANITLVRDGAEIAATGGDYGEEGFIYQGLAVDQPGPAVVLGAWVIDGEPAGMGLRESDGPITDNASRFVPHLIG